MKMESKSNQFENVIVPRIKETDTVITPWLIFSTIPNNEIEIPYNNKAFSTWLSNEVIGLNFFAPGVKSYRLLPEGYSADFFYYYMGDSDRPISFIKLLKNGMVVCGVPAFSPLDTSEVVRPEFVLGYCGDFCSIAKLIYKKINYSEKIEVVLALKNVAEKMIVVSNIELATKANRSYYFKEDSIDITYPVSNRDNLNCDSLKVPINRFLTKCGIQRFDEDALPI
ncbi:MAG: hypothetical protein ABII64_04290 [Elusimicrobiota bacterium]